MNALEGAIKLEDLDRKIDALTLACDRLDCDFDHPTQATVIDEMISELEAQRDDIEDRLKEAQI